MLMQRKVKPVIPEKVEVITFLDFIKYGIENGTSGTNGFPWSFTWNTHAISHENNECYLINISNSDNARKLRFTPNHVLVAYGDKGEFVMYTIAELLESFELVPFNNPVSAGS